MTNKELYAEMIRANKGAIFANKSKLANILGCGKDKINVYCKGLEYTTNGHSKDYLIADVASRILNNVGMD
ncbi:MAG: hypothetical protein ACRCUS_07710 [Anaerovoracaceae bacterium]